MNQFNCHLYHIEIQYMRFHPFSLTFFSTWIHLFALFLALFIPFWGFIFPSHQNWITRIWLEPIEFMGKLFFNKSHYPAGISSDSSALYLLIFLLFISAFLLSFITLIFKQLPISKGVSFIRLFLVYYLSFVLFKYGLDKVFLNQFPTPEANLLYTNLGKIDHDLLYWISMSTAPTYTVFSGFMEIIPALFLLLKKVRSLGLCLLSLVLTNILFVNIGFDISVKLFSAVLLFITLLLLAPQLNSIRLFFLGKPSQLSDLYMYTWKKGSFWKLFFVLSFFVFALIPTFLSYQKQYKKEVPFRGAYEVVSAQNQRDSTRLFSEIKRIFIHKDAYLIVETNTGEMEDYPIQFSQLDSSIKSFFNNQKLEIIDRQLGENSELKSLTIRYNKDQIILELNPLDWQKMPLLHPHFHWTVD